MDRIGITYQPRFLIIFGSLFLLLIQIITILINKKRNKSLNIKKRVIASLFIIYIYCAIGVTLLPITIYYADQSFRIIPVVNLVPFQGFTIEKFSTFIGLENIFGNLLLLTPLVVFSKLLFEHRLNNLKRCILLVFVCSLSIEVVQYLEGYFQLASGRITDITDIILNTSGGFIGCFIYNTLFKKKI